MLEEQKKRLSSLIDGDQIDLEFVDTVIENQDLYKCWHRYHVVRDVMRNNLSDNTLAFNISEKVADAIANEKLYDQAKIASFNAHQVSHLVWIKVKDVVGKLSQVGLAACVTLAIIAGVQYQQGSSNDLPVLNTMPIGVSVAPVGGLSNNNYQTSTQEPIDAQQYNKIRLLAQDYELQKRLSKQ